MSSDSDSEPEELTSSRAKQEAIQTRTNERNAVKHVRHVTKLKRREDNERRVQQKEKKMEKLSKDLLNQISVDNVSDNEKRDERKRGHESESSAELKKAKTKKAKALVTKTTRFDVIDTKSDLFRLASNKCVLNFKDQMLYNSSKNQRISTFSLKGKLEKKNVK